jgi:DNA-binding HxlR family transcriptional regulator
MEKLSRSKDVAANKLLIIYVMFKLKMAINGVQLTNYVLEQRLMDYFSLQQHLNELVAAGYVDAAAEPGAPQKKAYRLTAGGAALLEEMKGIMPRAEKNRVDRTVAALRAKGKDEFAVSADYMPLDENRQTVCLSIMEGDFVAIKIEMQTASKTAARQICEKWKTQTADVYSKIVALLT